MAIASPRRNVADRARDLGRPWVVAVLAVLFSAGVHLDGWAHNHGRVDESFFTPWHAVLYGSYVVLAAALVRPVLARRAAGASWGEAVEGWERLAVAGVVVFFAGGLGDMAWHTAFGIEEDLEALLSPTHLTLAAGGTLMGTAAYLGSRPASEFGWLGAGPAVLATVALWSVVLFMTQFMHPLVELWPTADWRLPGEFDDLGAALGVAGFVFFAVTSAAVLLVLLRDDRLPVGGLALVVALVAALAVTQGDHYALAVPVALAGVVLEGVASVLRPRPAPGWHVRVWAFAVPAVLTSGVFVGLALGPSVVWPIDLWAGSIVGAGLLGALVSTVVVPPRLR